MRQEPHRVYWQQWTTSIESNNNESSQRELVTKSAAVRISEAARAMDVTRLLRNTMPHVDGKAEDDSLVLVATLYNAPPIQFQHEVHKQNNDTTSTTTPLHVVKTLKPEENPLTVRDALLTHLQQQRQHDQQGISPKVQWFFVPSCSTTPNCIELDGYCTSDEHEYDDDESDSDDESTCIADQEHEASVDAEHWWRNESFFVTDYNNDDIRSTTAAEDSQQDENGMHPSSSSNNNNKRLQREMRRFHQLRHVQSALDRHTVSGYLLKRSHHDRHVWRKVYVVLSDDVLWVVSRLYNHDDDDDTKIAHYTKISLHRAMLIQATAAEYSPLCETPHAFEVLSKSGTLHVFRAASEKLQHEWMACLQAKITQLQDNDFLHHAELIIQDEVLAYNKRIQSVAVMPLVNVGDENEEMKASVLRWGMDVAAYREACRRIQLRMPAKRPIVVVTENDNGSTAATATPRRLFASPNGTTNGENVGGDSQLDSDTRDLIVSTWDSAAVLLTRGVLLVRSSCKPNSNSLESQCRHIDYVITGRFRSLHENEVIQQQRVDRSNDAPPVDLFDALLAQLQSGCSSKQQMNGAPPTETPLGK